MLVFVIHEETQEVDPVTQQAGDALYTYCSCLIGIASLVHVCMSITLHTAQLGSLAY